MSIYRDDLAAELDSPIGLTGVNRAGLGDNFDDKGPGYAYQPSLGAAFVSVGGRNEVSALATGAGTLASPWTGWEAAVNALPVKSHIHFSAGYYTLATRIDVKDEWTITGDGKRCTIITSALVGTSIRVGTSVSSAIGNVTLSGFTINNTNGSNTGSGILMLSGWNCSIRDVKIIGHRYGLSTINVQMFSIRDSTLESQLVAGAWLVNNGDYNLTYADLDYSDYTGSGTNVLVFDNIQCNQALTGAVGIADDGGLSRNFINSNFNGGTNAIRFAAANQVQVNADFEGQSEDCVKCISTSFRSGTAVGTNGEIVYDTCTFFPDYPNSKRGIDANLTQSTILKGCVWHATTPLIRNSSGTNIVNIRSVGNTGALFDGTPASYFDLASDNANRQVITSLPVRAASFRAPSTGAYGFSSAAAPDGTADALLARIAAKQIAMQGSSGGSVVWDYTTPSAQRIWVVPDFAATMTGLVASIYLTGQTTTIAATNLLASAPAGLYQVNIFLRPTVAGAAGTVTVTTGWNDGTAAQSITSPAVNLNTVAAGTYYQITQTIQSGASQNITYATTVAGAAGNPEYSLRMTLSRIA